MRSFDSRTRARIIGIASETGAGRRFISLGGGETAARLLAFAASLYLARRLGAAAYGAVALAGAILIYFSYVVDLGIDTLGVSEVSKDHSRLEALMPSLVLARLAVAGLLVVVVVTGGLLVLPQPEGAILAACSLSLLPRAVNVRWGLLGLDRAGWVALARTVGELLAAVLIVGLVRETGDLGRVPAAQVAGEAAAALVVLVALGRLGALPPVSWRPGIAGPVLRAARPLVLHSVLALVVFNCDLILLRFFRDAATVGRYAAAYTLVSFLSNLGVAFGYSLLPAFARLEPDGADSRALYHQSLAQSVALTLPLAVGGAIVSVGLIRLAFGPVYAPSAAALGVLLWTVPAVWSRTAGQMALIARGRQRDVLRVTAATAALAVILDLLVIPRYGMLGAAAVSVVAEAVRFAMTAGLCARAGLALPGPMRFMKPVAAAGVMAAVVWSVRDRPAPAAIAVGAAVYALVLALAGAVRFRANGLPELRV